MIFTNFPVPTLKYCEKIETMLKIATELWKYFILFRDFEGTLFSQKLMLVKWTYISEITIMENKLNHKFSRITYLYYFLFCISQVLEFKAGTTIVIVFESNCITVYDINTY